MGFLSALARISLDMTVVTLIIIYLPGNIWYLPTVFIQSVVQSFNFDTDLELMLGLHKGGKFLQSVQRTKIYIPYSMFV